MPSTLLVVGFYLFNLGYVALFMQNDDTIENTEQLLEVLSIRVGLVAMVLGVVHLANVWVFNRIRRHAAIERQWAPPVAPDTTRPSGDHDHRPLRRGVPGLPPGTPLGRGPAHLRAGRLRAGGSEEARRRFPALDHAATRREITVVADDGATYRGDGAWIVVLWAVVSTRQLANDVAAGRRRWLFGGLKGATEWVRRLTAGQEDPVPVWPPPNPADGTLDRARAPRRAHPLGDHRRRPHPVPRAGYEATTMRAIADRAGVSVGNAYYYFASKEHLIQGFYDRAAAQHGECRPSVSRADRDRRAHRGAPVGVVRAVRAVPGVRRCVLPQRRRSGEPAEPVQPGVGAGPAGGHRAVAGRRRRRRRPLPKALRGELPELLWLYQMGLVLFWVHDRSAEAVATRLVVARTVPIVVRAIEVSRVPALRSILEDLLALLADLRGFAAATVSS